MARTRTTAPPTEYKFRATLRGREFLFHTTWGLFSPKRIDPGTALLLERIEIPEDAVCLDLGCGYGPIGIVMATLAPRGRVYMVDKDYVAVRYAKRNVAANRLNNCRVLLSNVYEELPPDLRFDVIAANLPANAGKQLHLAIFHGAYERLNIGGRFYVVTVNGLRRFIRRNFKEIFDNYKKLCQGPNHTVAMAVREF